MWELQAVIEFMYKGEVNVSKSGLADLMRCAGTLQISGLCGAHAQSHLNQMVVESEDTTAAGGASVLPVMSQAHQETNNEEKRAHESTDNPLNEEARTNMNSTARDPLSLICKFFFFFWLWSSEVLIA